MRDRPRLLLLIPTSTYRAEDFLDAAHRLDVDVTVASEEASSLEHLSGDRLITLDLDRPGDSVESIRSFAARHPIAGVVGVDDRTSMAAAVIGEALGLRGNPVDAVHAARDKLQMRDRLRAGGVSQPRYRHETLESLSPDVIASEVGFPCVVKPRRLAGGKGVIRVDGPDALEETVRRVISIADADADTDEEDGVLVEQYVPGWEIAVEGLLRDDGLTVLAVFDKPDPLVGPYFAESIYVTPSRLPADTLTRVAESTEAAARALGITGGPIHAELRGDGDELWMIELAARSIGGLCSRTLRFGTGWSLEEIILRHGLGLPLPSTDRERRAAGVRMVHAEKPGRFVEVRGVEAAKTVPGIEAVDWTVHEGQQVEPLPEGALYLGFLFARADTPAEVEEALREAAAHLTLVVEEGRDPAGDAREENAAG